MSAATRTLLLLVVACGGGGPADPDGPPGPDAAPGDPFADRIGLIRVAEQDGLWDGGPGQTTGVVITIADGPTHPFHHESGRSGECRLLEYLPETCTTPCDGVCTVDGCVAWPTDLDAGTITLTGLLAPLEIERDDVTGRYYPGALPADLFDAGATITATGTGGADVPAFTLAAIAPPPIATAFPSPVELGHADDAELRWTAAGDTAVFLTISSPNGGHGAPYDAIIECASADDGLITVPGAFVAALGPVAGLPCLVGHECPPATLTRYRAASTVAGPGELQLWTATERVFFVRHDWEH